MRNLSARYSFKDWAAAPTQHTFIFNHIPTAVTMVVVRLKVRALGLARKILQFIPANSREFRPGNSPLLVKPAMVGLGTKDVEAAMFPACYRDQYWTDRLF